MATKKVAPKVVFIPEHWLKGELKWSPKWKDPLTGVAGSPFYIKSNNLSFKSGEGGVAGESDGITGEVVRIRVTPKDAPAQFTEMFLVYGGKAAMNSGKLPPTAYFNVQEGYVGCRIMKVELFEELTGTGAPALNAPTTADNVALPV